MLPTALPHFYDHPLPCSCSCSRSRFHSHFVQLSSILLCYTSSVDIIKLWEYSFIRGHSLLIYPTPALSFYRGVLMSYKTNSDLVPDWVVKESSCQKYKEQNAKKCKYPNQNRLMYRKFQFLNSQELGLSLGYELTSFNKVGCDYCKRATKCYEFSFKYPWLLSWHSTSCCFYNIEILCWLLISLLNYCSFIQAMLLHYFLWQITWWVILQEFMYSMMLVV